MTMVDFLPLTLDAESVTFSKLERTGEWEILIEREDAEDIAHYTQYPDSIYEQLMESGDLKDEDGEIVQS